MKPKSTHGRNYDQRDNSVLNRILNVTHSTLCERKSFRLFCVWQFFDNLISKWLTQTNSMFFSLSFDYLNDTKKAREVNI